MSCVPQHYSVFSINTKIITTTLASNKVRFTFSVYSQSLFNSFFHWIESQQIPFFLQLIHIIVAQVLTQYVFVKLSSLWNMHDMRIGSKYEEVLLNLQSSASYTILPPSYRIETTIRSHISI